MKILALIALSASLALAQTPAKDAKKPVAPAAKPVAPAVKPVEPAKPATPAKAEPAKKAEAVKPAVAGFVGNKDSKTFHKADCKTTAKMKEANKVTFTTKEEAEKQGFKACKVCLK